MIKGDLLQFELMKMSQSESDAGRNGRGTFTPMMFVRPWWVLTPRGWPSWVTQMESQKLRGCGASPVMLWLQVEVRLSVFERSPITCLLGFDFLNIYLLLWLRHAGSSSLTRDQTWAPCPGSEECGPLDQQGSPWALILTLGKISEVHPRCPAWIHFSHHSLCGLVWPSGTATTLT